MLKSLTKSLIRTVPLDGTPALPPATVLGSPQENVAPKEKPALVSFDRQAEARSRSLIKELGSQDFRSRENATRTLLELGQSYRGDSTFRDLLGSTIRTHPDPEVRSRAGRILTPSTHAYLTCQEERIEQLSSNPLAQTDLGRVFLQQKRNEIHDLFVSFRIAPSLFNETGSTTALRKYCKVFGVEDFAAEYSKAIDERALSSIDQTAFTQVSKLQARLKEISDRTGNFFIEQEEGKTFRRITIKANDFEHRLTLRIQGSIEQIPGSAAYRPDGGSALVFHSEVLGPRNAEDYVFMKRISSVRRTPPTNPQTPGL